MPLETAPGGIPDLNPSWPTGTDPKSQGDDHIRLIKGAVQDSLPGIQGPWETNQKITAAGFDASTVRIEKVGTPVDATDAARKGDTDALNDRLTPVEADILALETVTADHEVRITNNRDDIDALLSQAAKFTSYGNVQANGAIYGGSGDFTVAKVGTGEYEITFTETATSQYAQSLSAMTLGVPPFSTARTIDVFPGSTTLWGVYIYNTGNGQAIDADFTFIRQAN